MMCEEFRSPATYNTILCVIAKGAATTTEIARQSGVDIRTLNKYLDTLEEKALVRRETSLFAEDETLGAKRKRGTRRYVITDPYVRFWFRFLLTDSSFLRTREAAVEMWAARVEAEFADFARPAFEEVCRQYMLRRAADGDLPLKAKMCGRWWTKDEEIAFVAQSADQRTVLVAEFACDDRRMGVAALRALETKARKLPLRGQPAFHYWLFSRAGFDEELRRKAEERPDVRLVGMTDLLT